jgi:histone acetyltransferase (RNA polymerase elongator complex component)
LRATIDAWRQYGRPVRHPVQLAFFGGNFLGLPMSTIRRYLALAATFIAEGRIDSVRFSTRPDTIQPQRLDAIQAGAVDTIEIGAQSMDDRVLAAVQRGHTAADIATAVAWLHQRHYRVGIQLMIGLPYENEKRMLASAEHAAALAPDFVRLYPTIVLAGSRLATWYRQGRYRPLPLDEAVHRTKAVYQIFEAHQIPVIRMGLQDTPGLNHPDAVIAGPHHPALGDLVLSEIWYERVARYWHAHPPTRDTLSLKVHPRNVSRMIGQHRRNIDRLVQAFGLRTLRVLSEPALSPDELVMVDTTTHHPIP